MLSSADPFLAASPTYIQAHRAGLHVKTEGGFEVMPERWTVARFIRVMTPALVLLAALVAVAAWRGAL